MHQYEKGQRWLWIFAYILIPLNIAGAAVTFVYLLANEMLGGLGALLIIAGIVQHIFLLIGINRQRPWAWYLLLITLALQCLLTPLKHHNKKAFTYEVASMGARYMKSIGQASYTPEKPSLFDGDNIIIFILLLFIWTTPNFIYFYKRASFFNLEGDPFGFGLQDRGSADDSPHIPALTPDEKSALYAQALDEAESGNADKGTWAKALVDANGDTNQAKAKYIAARVDQIQRAEQKEAFQKQLVDLADQISAAERRFEQADSDMKLIDIKFSASTVKFDTYCKAEKDLSAAKSHLATLTRKRDNLIKRIGRFNQSQS